MLSTDIPVLKYNLDPDQLASENLSPIIRIHTFGQRFYAPINSYGHVKMVSSTNHTYSWESLTRRLISTLGHILSLVTDNNFS